MSTLRELKVAFWDHVGLLYYLHVACLELIKQNFQFISYNSVKFNLCFIFIFGYLVAVIKMEPSLLIFFRKNMTFKVLTLHMVKRKLFNF